ncbi:hypothetical protein RHMOL_Rhmol10G0244700 [Rhododendron molle]|uniref:Uncharacterized protein n=1 Tax=Rhododendron molle TaxID=49168 RepID=A0ACC0M6Z0_RHOML|nr:hypothetical protein RHMOL_Rhmol10G0244700 [Rhododendron molle]
MVSQVSKTNGSSFDVELNDAKLNTAQRSVFHCENSLAIGMVEPNLNQEDPQVQKANAVHAILLKEWCFKDTAYNKNNIT